MATNKIHFAALLYYDIEMRKFLSPLGVGFNHIDAAVVTTPDSMRCWVGSRAITHFTLNPSTKEISFMEMPGYNTKLWSKDLLLSMYSYDAGKPGDAVVDESTIPAQFWKYNNFTEQNFLFYLHLVQDASYDRFIRSMIDVSGRYEDVYWFKGKKYSGNDLRGKGLERWNGDGLLNQLDAQFYVRLAKRFYEATGILINRHWVEVEMKPAFFEAYSKELAENTVKFISISDVAEDIISSHNFDQEIWPVSNKYVDQYLNWMMEDMTNAIIGHHK